MTMQTFRFGALYIHQLDLQLSVFFLQMRYDTLQFFLWIAENFPLDRAPQRTVVHPPCIVTVQQIYRCSETLYDHKMKRSFHKVYLIAPAIGSSSITVPVEHNLNLFLINSMINLVISRCEV